MSKDIVAGGITGILSQLLTWPTEFLKTTKQLPKYNNQNIFDSIKKEYTIHGPKVFYRGSLAQVISAFPRSATRFTVYNKTYSFLDKNNINPVMAKMFSGVIAGSTEAFFVQTPAEIIKIECINKKINAVNATKTIFLENGFLGFWTGVWPTVIRQGSSQGISFAVFHTLQPYLDSRDIGLSALISGGCGGIVATLCNNPIDVVKTYQQSDRKSKSILEIMREIKKTKTIAGFYTGISFRLMRMVPSHGLTFYFYDIIKKYV